MKKINEIKIGIDLGMSSTKIVLVSGRNILDKFIFDKTDKTCMIMKVNELLDVHKIKKAYVTGGKSQISLSKVSIKRVEETKAIGLGGSILAGSNKCIVASVGTGTCIVSVDKSIKHIGGTGVGGGTLEGLCNIFGLSIDSLSKIASKGNLKNVDFKVADITGSSVGIIPKDATASNLGKLSKKTKKQDIAIGIINLIAESVSVVVLFSAKSSNTKKVVVVGRTPRIAKVRHIMKKTAKLFNYEFIFPNDFEFATAYGATQVT